MEQSVKDKHIILGFVGFAILLISSIATLIVAEKFNQDNFVRLIVLYAATSLAGCSIYLSRQSSSTHTKSTESSSARKDTCRNYRNSEDQPQDAHKPVTPASMATGGEATPDIRPTEIAISPGASRENRADYEDRGATENEERIAMVMEYIHFIMPRIADKETVNHICGEVNNWMRLHSYKPKPIKGRLTKDISNIPPRHFVWNISELFHVQEILYGDNRARSSAPFSTEFADTDIATIKNFKGRAVKDTDSH